MGTNIHIVASERGRGYTRSNGEDEVLNAALLQELGEERGPVRLHLDVRGLHHRRDLLGLADGNTQTITRAPNERRGRSKHDRQRGREDAP